MREAFIGYFTLLGTSKNSRLGIRREILPQIEGKKVQEYFVYFKLFSQKSGAKAPVKRRAGVFRGALL